MLKKIFFVFISGILLLNTIVFAEDHIPISAKSAILVDADTGRILFAKNENEKLPMASTTKIMTALLAAESGRLYEEHTVTKEMVSVEGTSMGLLVGDTVSVEDLIYGMLLQSGNDAANAAAIILAGGLKEFAVMMNERAKEIGMDDTNFVTPSGLDSDEHYTTALDMSKLARVALENAVFADICSMKSARIKYGNPEYVRTLTNHNKLLKMYDGTIGIKTGFTKKSGRCLVSAAQRNDVKLVVVTLNDGNDWNTHMELFDYGFEKLSSKQLASEDDILKLNVVGGTRDSVDVSFAFVPTAAVQVGESNKVICKIVLPKFIYAPVEINQIVGEATFYYEDVVLCNVPIIAKEDVYSNTKEEVDETSIFGKILSFFKR